MRQMMKWGDTPEESYTLDVTGDEAEWFSHQLKDDGYVHVPEVKMTNKTLRAETFLEVYDTEDLQD